jgi:hypothetical protein
MAKHNAKTTDDTDSLQNSSVEGMKESIIPQMEKINEKVTSMKNSITDNPDSTSDKIIRLAVPALIGIAVGKLVALGWKKTTKQESTPSATDTESNIFLAVVFAAVSAVVSTFASRLTTIGTNAYIGHRKNKRANTI